MLHTKQLVENALDNMFCKAEKHVEIGIEERSLAENCLDSDPEVTT